MARARAWTRGLHLVRRAGAVVRGGFQRGAFVSAFAAAAAVAAEAVRRGAAAARGAAEEKEECEADENSDNGPGDDSGVGLAAVFAGRSTTRPFAVLREERGERIVVAPLRSLLAKGPAGARVEVVSADVAARGRDGDERCQDGEEAQRGHAEYGGGTSTEGAARYTERERSMPLGGRVWSDSAAAPAACSASRLCRRRALRSTPGGSSSSKAASPTHCSPN
mmetsp:Transcript_10733/g.37949  ORF Transcript_10733/g.37949 Transcript_10733/m.37949 type:complete len:222 (+) Transcript_10733:57-722(+)